MMKIIYMLLLTLLLSGCSCNEETPLHKECSAACYSGPRGTAGVGECRVGRSVCDADGNLIECAGEVLPRANEVCGDDADYDCSGVIGDHDPQIDQLCGYEQIGECRLGQYKCVDNQLQCVGGIGPREEQCGVTLRDANCDGVPNNITPNLCYESDHIELTYPHAICRPGQTMCLAGNVVCVGQVLPRGEICRNRVDDDCNGYVDDAPATSTTAVSTIDIAFVIDVSGSMSNVIAAVQQALIRFIHDHDQPGFRYALVTLADTDGISIVKRSDFVSGADIEPYFNMLSIGSGADEPSYDAIHDMATGRISLTWRPSTLKIILFFGDENAQTALQRNLTESAVVTALMQQNIVFYGFINWLHWEGYDEIANDTGGRLFSVYSSILDIETSFTQIFNVSCSY